jgi:hypothetical protein
MSVLTVLAVPAGILFGADRNVTLRSQYDAGRGRTVEQVGYLQRPKVLKWPNRQAIVGYFGLARIAGQATDLWLYDFIGRNLNYQSLGDVAQSLVDDFEADIPASERRTEPLVLHLAGFDEIDGELAPVIWFIHNTAGLTDLGRYKVADRFNPPREELRAAYPPERFRGMKADEIRTALGARALAWQPYWFRQGYDLAALNTLDEVTRLGMRVLVQRHPARIHDFPTTLVQWEQHLRFAVLTLGAYFDAFYAPYDRVIGGGVDVVSVAWPSP